MNLLSLTATKSSNIIDVDLDGHDGLFLYCLKDICIYFRNPNKRENLFFHKDGFAKFTCVPKIDIISDWDILEYCLHNRLDEISFNDFKKSLEYIIENFEEYFYRIDLRYREKHAEIIKKIFETCALHVNGENYKEQLFQRDFESYYRQFVKHVFTNTNVVFEHSGFSYEEIIDVLQNIYKKYIQKNVDIEYTIDFPKLYFEDKYGQPYA
jgi:hypothetical protein